MDSDWATTSGRAISASVGAKGAAADSDMDVDWLVGTTKPGLSMWKAWILTVANYTELQWELEITPNVIIDREKNVN